MLQVYLRHAKPYGCNLSQDQILKNFTRYLATVVSWKENGLVNLVGQAGPTMYMPLTNLLHPQSLQWSLAAEWRITLEVRWRSQEILVSDFPSLMWSNSCAALYTLSGNRDLHGDLCGPIFLLDLISTARNEIGASGHVINGVSNHKFVGYKLLSLKNWVQSCHHRDHYLQRNCRQQITRLSTGCDNEEMHANLYAHFAHAEAWTVADGAVEALRLLKASGQVELMPDSKEDALAHEEYTHIIHMHRAVSYTHILLTEYRAIWVKLSLGWPFWLKHCQKTWFEAGLCGHTSASTWWRH